MTTRAGAFQYARILIIVVLLAVTLKIFVLDAVAVPGRSMAPAILAGDFLLLDKTGYSPGFLSFRTPGRGEVVAFTLPDGIEGSSRDADETGETGVAGKNRPLILKRCVAAPGDTVVFHDGDLLVNGINAAAGIGDGGMLSGDGRPRTIPRKGDTILLDSAGCALWSGFIEMEGHSVGHEEGGAITVDGSPAVSYTVEHDYILVLGDNHPVSLDSRTWGYIPASRVVGEAVMVYWSLDDDGSVRWDRIGTLVE